MGGGGGAEDLGQSAGIELEGVVVPGREEGEADDLSGFDDGGVRCWVAPPAGEAGLAGGVGGLAGNLLGVQELTKDLAEAIATVAHGDAFEDVGGSLASPPGGDMSRGGLGGEGAFELVGHDQDAEGFVSLEGGWTVGVWGRSHGRWVVRWQGRG